VFLTVRYFLKIYWLQIVILGFSNLIVFTLCRWSLRSRRFCDFETQEADLLSTAS
jgi:hypothetical protein